MKSKKYLIEALQELYDDDRLTNPKRARNRACIYLAEFLREQGEEEIFQLWLKIWNFEK